MKWYQSAEQFVSESFKKANNATSLKHLLRTVYWLKEIYPEADEAMQIAALSHDIQRAFKDKYAGPAQTNKNSFLDKEHLRFHQEKGGEIIAEFLLEQGASRDFAERVKMLVSKHEEGGTDEQNILKDADSISFFENNVDHFVEVFAPEKGKDVIKAKFDWMYNRITSDKAKQIVRPWYEAGIERLS